MGVSDMATASAPRAADQARAYGGAVPVVTQERTAAKARRKAAQQWLNKAARPGRFWVLAAAFVGCLQGATIIAQAFFLATIVHATIIDQRPLPEQVVPLAGLLGTILLRALFTYLQEAMGAAAARRVALAVNGRMAASIVSEGPALTRGRDSGALATAAIEHVIATEGYVARYSPQKMIALIVPVMIIAAVWPANWVVAVFFAVIGPLVPVFMGLIGMRAAAASAKQFDTLARMGGHFLDRLRGMTTLKLFGQAEVEREAVSNVAEGFRKRTMRVLRIAFLSSATLEFFSTIAVAMVALYVGLGLLGQVTIGPVKDITLGTGLFVLLLAPEFFQPLRQLGVFYHERAAALGAAEVLMGLIPFAGEKPKPVTEPVTDREALPDWVPHAPPAVIFDSVALHYPNGRWALEDVSLAVRPGETIALVGPSGAGKSSLIDVLLGFQRRTGGEIRINDHVLTPDDAEIMQSLCAWAGQRPYLFHGTIAENIALGICDPGDVAVLRAAEAAHVMDFVKDLPEGLLTPIGEQGFGLSGGQARRVAIARAFVKDAPLLMLDEPTANLDRETEHLIIKSLKTLSAGRTTILCTHSPRLAELADRVVRIREGRIVEKRLEEVVA